MPNRLALTQPRSQLLYAYPLQALQYSPLQYYRNSEAAGATVAIDQLGRNNGTYNNTANQLFGVPSLFTNDPSTGITVLNNGGYITLPLLDTGGVASLVCMMQVPDANQFGYVLKVGDSATGYGLGVGGATLTNAGVQLIGAQDNVGWLPSTFSLTPGKWYHCVMTIAANGNALFYVAGSLVGTVAAGNTITPTGHSYIGTDNKTACPHISISDCLFYNYILTPTQIATLALLAQ